MHMEAPFSTKLAVLTRCILVACLIQSNYAEVCFIRSHRGYGGCLRWFLPAEKVSTCTSIKLGGYATTSYKRSQIIEFDQPFVSDISGEVQDFLEKQVPSLATAYVKKNSENSGEYVTTGDGTSDQVLTSTVSMPTPSLATSHVNTETANSIKYVTTVDANSDPNLTAAVSKSKTEANKYHEALLNGTQNGTKSTKTLNQPSTDRAFLSTTECPNLVCPENMTSGELTLAKTYDDVMNFNNNSDEEILRQCGSRKILACGCEREDDEFFPVGVTYNAGEMCRCYRNRSLICYRNTDVGNTVCENLDDDEERILFFSRVNSDDASIIIQPTGCHDLYNAGFTESRTYCVYPKGWNVSSLMVRCDMGVWPQEGWMVIQRRVNGSVDFYRNWTEYKNGFGDLNHEFWMGNENVYHLTNQTDMKLRIGMQNGDGKPFGIYSLFRIDSEDTNYQLTELGNFFSGTGLKDAMRYHVNASFSTYDRDGDSNPTGNCAEENHGGWWFADCLTMCYLNGVYGESQSPGIRCSYNSTGGQYNVKSANMMITPVN